MSDTKPFNLEKGQLNIIAVVSVVAVVGGLIIGFYNQVVIPIRDIQSAIAQINITLNQHSMDYKKNEDQHVDFDKRLDALERAHKLK